MNIKGKCYTRTNDSGTHYARIILPKELRAFVAKAAIWRSLATKDDAEARDVGIVTAVASRTVFQEAAETFLPGATVVVDTEIVGEKIDLNTVVNTVSEKEMAHVAESLRKSFGITSTEPPTGNSTDSSGSSKESASGSSRAVKSSKKKSAAVQELSEAQKDTSPKNDDKVANYIERRPHGYYRLRFWVPRKLHGVVGKREFRVTLGTKDQTAAIEKAAPIVRELRQKIQRLMGAVCLA